MAQGSDRRLLLLSSRARNKPAIYAAVLPGVRVVEYSYETSHLDEVMEQVRSALSQGQGQGQGVVKVSSIAVVLHSSERELFLCQVGMSRLSRKSLVRDEQVRSFLLHLVRDLVDLDDWSARLDFLATYMAEQIDGGLLAKELEQMLNLQVGLSKNLEASDIQVVRGKSVTGRFLTVGEMYFDLPTLKNHLSQVGKVTKDGRKKLEGYEKIRVVGKGAFGHAVLYRRRADGLSCIIKEINMHELSAQDREMALTEVKVLAKLDHPNIVAYHDSFERDGVLMIEMEFVDGGNLAEFLAAQKTQIPERDILDVFGQMVSAIRYIHSRKVLHRDLKTANIFLTKEGEAKIGDFGIAKIMTTRQGGAQTVLGTPYYISPEMCEGKIYDEKSDIWALGCITYEMACLQKTFDGSNLPALVNKIMRGQFAPIRGDYSPLFKQLVRDLLQRDPEFRPTASEVLLQRLPELLAQFPEGDDSDDDASLLDGSGNNGRQGAKRPSRPPRSVLYYLKGYESTISLTPVQLPPRSRILQVCVSNTHIVALTSDYLVFTWGEGRRGQLGHGEVESWRSRPFCVEALKTKSIKHVGAGDGFSVFTSDKGIVMTCGDGSFGALGHGDWQSSALPKLVESLLTVDVSAVACGSEHVVVVSGQGDVYTWGRGEGGRLGLDCEDDFCSPQEMKIDTSELFVVNAKCSEDATVLLTDKGALFACGKNRYNRLGLDETKVFLPSHVEKVLLPTRVKSVRQRIVDLSMGPNHTVCIAEDGKLISMGRNSEAQLGRGHARTVAGPDVVKTMSGKVAVMVSCGATFTVVGTTENVLYFWGTRFMSPFSRPNTRDAFNASFGANTGLAHDGMPSEDVRASMQRGRRRRSSDSTGALVMEDTKEGADRTLATLNTTDLLHHQDEIALKDVVAKPQEILALYASKAELDKGEMVTLGQIQSQNQNIFLVVETTCPLARANPADGEGGSDLGTDILPPPPLIEIHEDPEALFAPPSADGSGRMDASATPDWLERELNDAEDIRRPSTGGGRQHKNRSDDSEKKSKKDKHKKKDLKPREDRSRERAASKSQNQEYQRRLEAQYQQRQNEIRLEAENAVRERERALNEEVVRLREELDRQRDRQKEDLNNKAGQASSACILQ